MSSPAVPQLSQEGDVHLFQKWDKWYLGQKPGEKILEAFLNLYSGTFDYQVFMDRRATQKRWGRCVEKVLDYVGKGQASNECDAVDNCLKDLAGGRLIVLYPCDRVPIVNRFCHYVKNNGSLSRRGLPCFTLDGDPDVKNDEKSGYKAIHQNIRIQLKDGTWYPFEVQFMNAYQHVWDKVQGPLFREPKLYSTPLHNKVKDLSRKGEKLCCEIDEILAEIAKCKKRTK